MSWLIRFYNPPVFWLDSTFNIQIINIAKLERKKKTEYYI
jgi:hypothetical protein